MKKGMSLLLICCMLLSSVMLLNASDATTIAGGSRSSSFVIRPDGSLWAWGWNALGQLGDGTTINRAYPVWVMDDVIAVSAQEARVMAIRGDGTLWAWGRGLYQRHNDDFELALRDRDRHTPIQIMYDATIVSAGINFASIVRSDSSLWDWSWSLHHSPRNIGEDVISISEGGFHMMAIQSDGTLFWPHGFDEIHDLIAISAGSSHSMAVQADGSLWTWGNNSFGQIGDGTITIYEYEYIRIPGTEIYIYTRNPIVVIEDNTRHHPVKIMNDVITASAGVRHSMAIRADGSLWAWGTNDTGQLGDGTNENRLRPVRVLEDVLAVSAGYNHTLAIRTDGSLWGWGSNWFGELGDESLGFHGSNIPVQIMDSVMLPGNITPVALPATISTPVREISVTLNGVLVDFDTSPIIRNDRTMVPFRAMFEALGMEIEWIADTRTAIGIRDNFRIELPIGSYSAYINGEIVAIDTPAIIYNDRTMVPVRFIAEASGADVDWNSATQTVIVVVAD